MTRRASVHPTELELRILKVLWKDSPLPVREIRSKLAESGRELAHTTVITTLNVMVRKRFVKRSMLGNACLFEPKLTQAHVSGQMLGDFVSQVFDGSASALMLRLLDEAEVTPAELKELQSLLKQRLQHDSRKGEAP